MGHRPKWRVRLKAHPAIRIRCSRWPSWPSATSPPSAPTMALSPLQAIAGAPDDVVAFCHARLPTLSSA